MKREKEARSTAANKSTTRGLMAESCLVWKVRLSQSPVLGLRGREAAREAVVGAARDSEDIPTEGGSRRD